MEGKLKQIGKSPYEGKVWTYIHPVFGKNLIRHKPNGIWRGAPQAFSTAYVSTGGWRHQLASGYDSLSAIECDTINELICRIDGGGLV